METTRLCEHEGCEKPAEFLWQPSCYSGRHVTLCRRHRDSIVKMAEETIGAMTLSRKLDAKLKVTPLTVQALLEYADCKGLTEDDASYLDEAVHDLAESMDDCADDERAAKINNGGLSAQVEYLLGILGPRDAKLAIDDAVAAKNAGS
jgi:hypothetical protein